jgi:hypothetical protein
MRHERAAEPAWERHVLQLGDDRHLRVPMSGPQCSSTLVCIRLLCTPTYLEGSISALVEEAAGAHSPKQDDFTASS